MYHIGKGQLDKWEEMDIANDEIASLAESIGTTGGSKADEADALGLRRGGTLASVTIIVQTGINKFDKLALQGPSRLDIRPQNGNIATVQAF